MATTKDYTPSNSEAYYAHKLAAIERRRKFWGRLPDRLFVGLRNIFLVALTACAVACGVASLGYGLIYQPIKEHTDWVHQVDRDLAELKSRPPVIQTIRDRELVIATEFRPCVTNNIHTYVTNVVTPTTIFWTNRDMSDFTHFTPQVTFPTNGMRREVTNVMLRGF